MNILVIDDEEGLRRSLCAYLEDLGYDALDAGNGLDGLAVMRANLQDLAAVIVDLNMPVLDGYGFLRQARVEAPELPIVVLSGVGVVDDALQAVRLGAWDFLTKPLHNFSILEHTLGKVMEKARLLRENREYQTNLEELVRQRTAELERTRRQIMHRLSRAAEYKDNETGHHVIRVGEIAAVLAEALGLGDEQCANLRDCAPLHDIGKIGVPDEVLLKPGKLDPAEWKVMQQHCMFGCEILGPLTSTAEAHASCENWAAKDPEGNELLDLARMLALLHHERWDGTGYPFGLAGEAIPLEARIVAVVDTYDALASERPYKKAFPEEKCLEIIRESSGTHFDPQVVEAFFRNTERIRTIRTRWND
ncbi:HD-GYP domain-containing protein [Desulfomicrobium escambiense]|uniref:HD-GYP domain-containing protein n=1 Tax=Desulfomicrobium escambiense TaxID=29503 RepID=UPI000415456E|nr:HD domain-containing phosphohydrolase [Desulfomicrobium escambiense]